MLMVPEVLDVLILGQSDILEIKLYRLVKIILMKVTEVNIFIKILKIRYCIFCNIGLYCCR